MAQVVLDLKGDQTFQAEIQLVVPLPWSRDDCDEMIHRTGDPDEFQKLLDQAEHVIEMPLAGDVSGDDLFKDDQARATQYQEVGRYISRHSQILIALWDGDHQRKGGTARVINWQQQGAEAPFAHSKQSLDETECGPVYHITTPRDEPGAKSFPVELKNLYLDSEDNKKSEADKGQASAEYYHKMWSWFDRFNAETRSDSKTFQTHFARSKDWVIPEDQRSALHEHHQHLLNFYAAADAAAMKHQARSHWVMRVLFGLVGVGVICFELYTHQLEDAWQLLVIYIGLLLIGGVVYRVAQRWKCHDQFVDYRALAESLRVQFFWRLAGLPYTVSDHYLRTMRSELDWIRQAVRSVQLMTHAHSRAERQYSANHQSENFKLIQERWVEDQLNFFRKSAKKNEKTAENWERMIEVFYSATLVLAVTMLVVHWQTDHMNHTMAVLVFLAAAGTAMLNEYAGKSAFAILARRYEWMRSLFSTAKNQLAEFVKKEDYDQAAELVKLLGEDALIENADWVIQTRDRQPEVPPPA